MNDKFTNMNKQSDEQIAQKLSQVAEQTRARSQFEADLEERLRSAHQPRSNWFSIPFAQISPTLRWVALMILLAVVLSWSIRSLIPAPQPANDNTPVADPVTTFTPAPNILPDISATPVQPDGYDFRGAKLLLQAPLPESPASAHVYLSRKDEPATEEQARALAARFGIQGEMYTTPNYVFNTTDYVFSDGKQNLQVYSERFFSYIADMSKTSKVSVNTPDENAETIIREFLQTRGFDFPFSISQSDFFQVYVVQPLAPDSISMQYESFTPPIISVMLDENGEVLRVDASLIDYDTTPTGEYEIISAQEALERVLDDYIMTGKMEWNHSGGGWPRDWYRSYPDNQPVTVLGHVSRFSPADANKPALVLIDGIPVMGNTSGLESLDDYTFVKATGQYIVENGIRKLNVETWDRKIQESSFIGTLSRQGDQVLLDDGNGQQYVLIDPPADVLLGSELEVYGAILDGKISWTFIRYFESNSGGGGGSGYGFYKLNLSGVPVPFPSPTAHPEGGIANQPTGVYTVQEGDTLAGLAQKFGTSVATLHDLNGLTSENIIYVGQGLVVPMPEAQEQKVQDLRGYLRISARSNKDGTLTKEYTLDVAQNGGSTVYTMEGSALHDMEGVNGRPILVTGTINTQGKLIVDNYTIPYPGLQFQILKGTQRTEQMDGQNVVIFTTEDGQSYVEFLGTNQIPNTTFITGSVGDLIEEEVLLIPDESFGGMPVAHVYQSGIIQENGAEMEMQGNRVYVNDESGDPGTEYTQPDLTINKVELVYFVSNPYYQVNDPNYDLRTQYIQPVWHFHGMYADGSEFDVLIQALKQDILLPELVPSVGVG